MAQTGIQVSQSWYFPRIYQKSRREIVNKNQRITIYEVLLCLVNLIAFTTAAPSDPVTRQYPGSTVDTPSLARSRCQEYRIATGETSISTAGSPKKSVASPQNLFLAANVRFKSNPNRDDSWSTYTLSTRDIIKFTVGFLPALTKALTKDNNATAAEKMRDIILSFLPLARGVVEDRSIGGPRSNQMNELENAEELVPAVLNYVVSIVDTFDVPTSPPPLLRGPLGDFFEFDDDDFAPNIPKIEIVD
ncbi:uncharacterized protein LOC121860456 [Homarus americanus]|uniref:uncharacterized protein LOC121860456 n=1 Tax=Homarus americanus TaxID=6706 RepID=UPI001C473C8F|nr:uncharacterized protein LOC121860456 [Homarus americanus]